MIKTVIDLKGAKRFKKNNNEIVASAGLNDLSLDINNLSNAKEFMRKMQTTSAYNQNFGGRPQAEQEFRILRDKQFSKLQISQILTANARETLNRWLTINDQDKFTGRIF